MIYQNIFLVSYNIAIYIAFDNISSSSYYITIQLFIPICISGSIIILHSIYLLIIHKVETFVYTYICFKDIISILFINEAPINAVLTTITTETPEIDNYKTSLHIEIQIILYIHFVIITIHYSVYLYVVNCIFQLIS